MKTIFENGDLVCRNIFWEKIKESEQTKGVINGDVIGKIIGRKKENNIVSEAVVFTRRNGQLYVRKYEAIDFADFKMPTGVEGTEIKLSDEMVPTMRDMTDYKVASGIVGDEDYVYEPENEREEYIREIEKGSGESHFLEITSDNIVEVSVASSGHKWSTASGRGAHTMITISDQACTRMIVNKKDDEDGMCKGFEIYLDGDAELEAAIRACEYIAKELRAKTKTVNP